MRNFTVGPVEMNEEIRKIGSEQVPYFRTKEFSKIMLENEQYMKKFAKASDDSKVVFLTGSGTAAMEAVVMNMFNENDKLLVVNGGAFGKRFVSICETHELQYTEIKIDFGKVLTKEDLEQYENKGYTGFIVNIHETSTGVLYDLNLISEFCKRNNIFLAIDAISSFLADSFDMIKSNVGVMITGSQKALACPPGVSIVVLSPEAVERVNNNKSKCMYLDLKLAMKYAEDGQTPFTPAIGILMQINAKLKEIEKNGGVDAEVKRTENQAKDFREKIKDLPFEIASKSLSNAVTPLHPLNSTAYKVFEILKEEYGIWIGPNGGDLKDKIFRVGHIGALDLRDNDILIDAFKDMQKRGLI